LRFCDDPELACCRGEAELGRLREENVRLRYELQESQRRADAARNELCLKCGLYHNAHNGACDGCRWKEMP
jgi:hypothetical protein